MRQPYTVDSIVHVLNRGTKKLPIYRQEGDLWRLFFSLYYLNSKDVPDKWIKELDKLNLSGTFVWPELWGKREPLVSILAFTILNNHFHLMLKEMREGGIKEFMHKFSMGYAKFINAKYDESGSLFQGPFKSQTVQTDEYLRYLAVYIMVKNTFELFPEGGLEAATLDFDRAFEWAKTYPFSSFKNYATKEESPIITKDILGELFPEPKEFKSFAKDCILGRNTESPVFLD